MWLNKWCGILALEFLDEKDYLNPFQSGFSPSFGTESAMITFDRWPSLRTRWGSKFLLVLLDLSAVFNNIDHSILLDWLDKLGLGILSCHSSAPSTGPRWWCWVTSVCHLALTIWEITGISPITHAFQYLHESTGSSMPPICKCHSFLHAIIHRRSSGSPRVLSECQ